MGSDVVEIRSHANLPPYNIKMLVVYASVVCRADHPTLMCAGMEAPIGQLSAAV